MVKISQKQIVTKLIHFAHISILFKRQNEPVIPNVCTAFTLSTHDTIFQNICVVSRFLEAFGVDDVGASFKFVGLEFGFLCYVKEGIDEIFLIYVTDVIELLFEIRVFADEANFIYLFGLLFWFFLFFC